MTLGTKIYNFIRNKDIFELQHFFKGFTKMLWSLEEGVIKFTIYGLLSFLLRTKFGTNNFIKFRQEAENDQIITHDDKQNQIEIGHL